MDKTTKTLCYLINLSFFLYFLILLGERILSVILSLTNGVNLYADGYNGYTYTLVFLSVIGWLICLITFCRPNIKALFRFDEKIDFTYLCIASGILLLSGMVHTEHTVPVIQFVSYGLLIIGILLKVVTNQKTSQNKVILWLSFAFLVAMSMAIPVMYRSLIELRVLFHVLEGIASFVLVGAFTYLLLQVFQGKEDLFLPWVALLLVLLDVPLIVMRWNEEINWFVLIFLSLSIVLFAVGYLYKKATSKRA